MDPGRELHQPYLPVQVFPILCSGYEPQELLTCGLWMGCGWRCEDDAWCVVVISLNRPITAVQIPLTCLVYARPPDAWRMPGAVTTPKTRSQLLGSRSEHPPAPPDLDFSLSTHSVWGSESAGRRRLYSGNRECLCHGKVLRIRSDRPANMISQHATSSGKG